MVNLKELQTKAHSCNMFLLFLKKCVLMNKPGDVRVFVISCVLVCNLNDFNYAIGKNLGILTIFFTDSKQEHELQVFAVSDPFFTL